MKDHYFKSKTKKIFITLLFCYSFNSFCQNPWVLLNPLPSYNNSLDIAFVSNTNGFIINDYQLLNTSDQGVTWQVKQAINGSKDISFKNSTGYIVGNSGLVLKSIDNGESWTTINTTFSYNYNTVNIIDDNTIILSSSNKIVISTDGGTTWISRSFTSGSIVKTFFTSALVGHAACTQGKIYKTIDGGINWYITESVSTIPSNFIAINFIDENNGYATRESSLLFKTTNGGETWTQVADIGEKGNSLYFFDNNNGFVSCDTGIIKKTNNGGLTWTSISYNPGNGYSNYYGVCFLDENIGFVCGQRGRIAKTNNGGLTWSEYSPTYNDIVKNQFKSDTVGYAMIYINGDFLKTIDGGNTWQIIGSINQFGSDFHFLNENLGYATSTENGYVYKTINGGATWAKTNNNVQVLNDGYNSNVYFYDENIGFTSGGFNSTRTSKTINGGATWQQIANHIFTKMQFLTPQVGYALYGGLNRSIDGGATWTLKLAGITTYYFFDENNGYAIGGNTFKKTTDGGTTWQSTNLLNTGNYIYMRFYNSQIGYIMRDDGLILRTVNAGQNWYYEYNSSYFKYLDLYNSTLSVSGSLGIIFKSTMPDSLNTIDNNNNTNTISVFPNPSSDFIYIQTKDNQSITSVELFSVLGKKIKSIEPTDNPNLVSINLGQESRGLYLLRIYLADGNISTKKIMLR